MKKVGQLVDPRNCFKANKNFLPHAKLREPIKTNILLLCERTVGLPVVICLLSGVACDFLTHNRNHLKLNRNVFCQNNTLLDTGQVFEKNHVQKALSVVKNDL